MYLAAVDKRVVPFGPRLQGADETHPAEPNGPPICTHMGGRRPTYWGALGGGAPPAARGWLLIIMMITDDQ